MRIAYFDSGITRIPKGGAGHGVHSRFVQTAFRKLGHEVLVPSEGSGNNGARANLPAQRGIYAVVKRALPKDVSDWSRDLYLIRSNGWRYRKIAAWIANEKPDMIIEKSSQYHVGGARVAEETGIPYIVEIHALAEERKWRGQRLHFARQYDGAVRRVALAATVVVVVSSYLKDELVRLGIEGDKIIVAPNAVDPELFRAPDASECDALRKRYDISNKFVVGFVGTMGPWHGIDLLPDVWQAVKRRVPDVRFVLVGPFGNEDRQKAYERLVRQKGADADFIIVGGVPVESVPSYIGTFDVALMPDSNDYGSPMKQFEYGALGKAVVMPRRGPIGEVLEDGVNGLMFEPGSVGDMADKIVQLAKDPALRARLGNRLKDDVLTNHTWTKNAERILDKLIEKRPELKG